MCLLGLFSEKYCWVLYSVYLLIFYFFLSNVKTNILSGTCHWKMVMIENNKPTAIQGHLLCCNYFPSLEDFSILTRESNDFKLKIMESVLIARDQSVFNNADSCLSVVIMFYHIWCPSIPLCECNCRLFNFRHYVASFAFYQRENVWAFNTSLRVTMKAESFESFQSTTVFWLFRTHWD